MKWKYKNVLEYLVMCCKVEGSMSSSLVSSVITEAIIKGRAMDHGDFYIDNYKYFISNRLIAPDYYVFYIYTTVIGMEGGEIIFLGRIILDTSYRPKHISMPYI